MKEEVLWTKINKTDTCWNWIGGKDKQGYGKIHIIGTRKYSPAHRVLYELMVGKIPNGLHIDHLCRNTSCVNPAHLEPVTPRENTLRGNAPSAICARRTHCDKGHPFFGKNLIIVNRKNRSSCRGCRTCRIEAVKRHYRKKMLLLNK